VELKLSKDPSTDIEDLEKFDVRIVECQSEPLGRYLNFEYDDENVQKEISGARKFMRGIKSLEKI
jgi:hypothetical protein